MRTTVDIEEDVRSAAKQMPRLKGQSLGRALSKLARRGLHASPEPVVEMRKGIPVWVHPHGAIPVTSELVRSLSQDE